MKCHTFGTNTLLTDSIRIHYRDSGPCLWFGVRTIPLSTELIDLIPGYSLTECDLAVGPGAELQVNPATGFTQDRLISVDFQAAFGFPKLQCNSEASLIEPSQYRRDYYSTNYFHTAALLRLAPGGEVTVLRPYREYYRPANWRRFLPFRFYREKTFVCCRMKLSRDGELVISDAVGA